jgi:hypothetical protein
MEDPLQFEVISKLNRKIRTTKEYWKGIVNIKHPSMKNKEADVKLALSESDEIRKSKSDEQVYLYYKKSGNFWTCVVAKHLNGEGFIITTYLTDTKKAGEIIWKR